MSMHAYSIENDVDTTGYIKSSQPNTLQCEYATITDSTPSGYDNINKDHSDDKKDYLEFSTT